MILTRPDYQYADDLETWSHINREALATYWMKCDEIVSDAGLEASLDEWPWFVKSQYDSWRAEFDIEEHPEDFDEYNARLCDFDNEDEVDDERL